MSDLTPSARRILCGVGYAASLVAPLLLLLDLSANFPEDWSNHLWMIGYYGDYFRVHGTLPTVMNIAPAVGLAQPVFYAWLFYPLLGLLAAAVGASLAVRLALFAMLAVQFVALVTAGRKIFGQTRMAYVVAVSVVWATYSLTNLYNRGALAEYFATGFFVTAIACGAAAAVSPPGSSRWFHGWLAGFFLLLMVGTHAPTSVVAAAFVALLAAGLAITWLRGRLEVSVRTWVPLAVGAFAGALILSPWVYANSLFGRKLSVAQGWNALLFRLENCDTFWGRFAPFPYDMLATENGIYGLGTPYLEAPINVVLLGILLWNLELCRRLGRKPTSAGVSPATPARTLLGVAIGWFLFLVTVSVSPWLAGGFGLVAPYIQYVYRLVSHCNAALLLAVFASGGLVARQRGYQRFRHQTNLVMAVGLTVAILGLWIKLQHAAVVSTPVGDRPASVARRQMEVVPDYTIAGGVRELAGTELREAAVISFPVGQDRAHFGETGAVNIELKQAGWVRTNAVAFPWTELWIDGKIARVDQLARTGHFQAVYLSAGGHEVRPVWRPDPVWARLHRLSQVCFALVLVVTAAWVAIRLFFKRRPAAESARAGQVPT